jgi:hypothetical protein
MTRSDMLSMFHSHPRAYVADRYQCHDTNCHRVTNRHGKDQLNRSSARLTHGRARLERPHCPSCCVESSNRVDNPPPLALRTSCRHQINSTQRPSLAARLRDSFAAIGRIETPARTQTHQRTRQARGQPILNQRVFEATEAVSASGHRHHWPFGNIWPSSHKSAHENHQPKGIYARGGPHSKSFLGSNGAHARALSAGLADRRNRGRGETRMGINQTAPEKDRGGWGVPQAPDTGSIIDLLSQFRAALSGIFGGPRFKKVGLPVKGLALTHAAAQDSLNGPDRWWGSGRSQNSPVAVSESRRGMP